MRPALFVRLALLALPLAIAACEDSDMFAEKKVPLAGDRRQLFPTGVPGVDYKQPPAQPSNSNVSINTEVPKNLLTDEPAPPPAAEQPKAKGAQKTRTPPRATRNAAPDDPWADTRQ
jgi:hypothetical protein